MAALVMGAAPRRVWHHLEPPLPLSRTGISAGIFTLVAGFAIGVPGFFAFAGQFASDNNAWMLRRLAEAPGAQDTAVAMVPYGLSAATLFIFLFFTPTGLLATYLVASGTLRAAAAYADPEDTRGDFILSGVDWLATTLVRRNKAQRARLAREQREGPEVPDRLVTGEWAGVDADCVLLASRRKAEWEAGAIILTSTDWYKLGVPFDMETPNGLRTAYPLTKMETVEVVRRGIQYELPPLSRAPTRKPPKTQQP